MKNFVHNILILNLIYHYLLKKVFLIGTGNPLSLVPDEINFP